MNINRSWRRAGLSITVAAAVGGILFVPLEAGTTRIVTTTAIACAPGVVYDYVTTPAHWPDWHPSSLAVHGEVDHSLRVGERVEEDFLVAGRRGRVTWRVVDREPARRWRVAGEIEARQAGTVTYRLGDEGSSTRFTREFEYAAPNLFFAIVNRVALRGRIDAESTDAIYRLRSRLESVGELRAHCNPQTS